MTGPEHYREAEKMLAAARMAMGRQEAFKVEVAAQFTAEAQAHATLALVAASVSTGARREGAQRDAWVRAFHGMDEPGGSGEATR
ncbi:hypothetical protein [Streptomyces prunicolor]